MSANTQGHMLRFGSLPYLAARPLIEGIERSANIDLIRTTSTEMVTLLSNGTLDVAMLGPMELLQLGSPVWILPCGCISSTGPTLMTRLFGRVPARRIRTVWAESGSASAIVKLLWAMAFRTELRIVPFNPAEVTPPADADAVVMMGDRVVADPPFGYEYQTDLARMWHRHTGLPLVFAAWASVDEFAAKQARDVLLATQEMSSLARSQVAAKLAKAHGWPEDLARRELVQDLNYEWTPAAMDGLHEFADLARAFGICSAEKSYEIEFV